MLFRSLVADAQGADDPQPGHDDPPPHGCHRAAAYWAWSFMWASMNFTASPTVTIFSA